ncbi:MAG: helix-turn-helix transcriptional regulator [Rubrobacteraceae bacterium]
MRKQLWRDVEALSGAGIRVEVEGDAEGRRYRLPVEGFSPVELHLDAEERAVLVGALRALRRDFPYAGPLRLAIANLIGTVSAPDTGETFAAIATREDESVARRVATLERAVTRRKRVSFDYYSISRNETSTREVEPYALSLLDGVWYVTGRDANRKALRQFRISRVRDRATFSTRKESGDFEVPEDFERGLAGPRAPWQLGEPDKTARIRTSRETSDAAKSSFPQAVTIEENEPFLVTRYSGERQLAGWLLSLGGELEVVSPNSLAERVVDGLERIASEHGGDV